MQNHEIQSLNVIRKKGEKFVTSVNQSNLTRSLFSTNLESNFLKKWIVVKV